MSPPHHDRGAVLLRQGEQGDPEPNEAVFQDGEGVLELQGGGGVGDVIARRPQVDVLPCLAARLTQGENEGHDVVSRLCLELRHSRRTHLPLVHSGRDRLDRSLGNVPEICVGGCQGRLDLKELL